MFQWTEICRRIFKIDYQYMLCYWLKKNTVSLGDVERLVLIIVCISQNKYIYIFLYLSFRASQVYNI